MGLALAEKILTLVIMLLEDVPPNLRMAKAIVWFHFWWPLGKLILKANGAPDEVIKRVDDLASEVKP